MSIFGMTSVIGIALGPFVGGAAQTHLNWRWIYWVQLISDAALLPVFWFILKETRGDVILASRAKKLRKQGRNAFAKSELNKSSVVEMLKVSFKHSGSVSPGESCSYSRAVSIKFSPSCMASVHFRQPWCNWHCRWAPSSVRSSTQYRTCYISDRPRTTRRDQASRYQKLACISQFLVRSCSQLGCSGMGGLLTAQSTGSCPHSASLALVWASTRSTWQWSIILQTHTRSTPLLRSLQRPLGATPLALSCLLHRKRCTPTSGSSGHLACSASSVWRLVLFLSSCC
jgi:hypothetical protein